MTRAAAILAEGLVKSYGAVRALDGLSLRVDPGEVVGVLGPNGAGKTTTIEILEGLRARDGGRAEVLGCDAADLRPVRRRIGIVTQNGSLPQNVSVREHVRFYAAIYRARVDEAAVLDAVGLLDKARQPVSRLSGGQKQRLMVAVGLIGDPEAAFLDEPTSELDPDARRKVWDLIRDTGRRGGRAILLTTHQMEEAQTLCDRIYVVDRGRVVAEGTPDALIRRHAPRQVISFATDATGMALLDGFNPVVAGGRVSITTERLEDTLALLMILRAEQGLAITDMHVARASLQDVFFAVTGRAMEA